MPLLRGLSNFADACYVLKRDFSANDCIGCIVYHLVYNASVRKLRQIALFL